VLGGSHRHGLGGKKKKTVGRIGRNARGSSRKVKLEKPNKYGPFVFGAKAEKQTVEGPKPTYSRKMSRTKVGMTRNQS